MTPGERCLFYAVLALAGALLVVRWIGEWINGGFHALRHHIRHMKHRWNHRNCRHRGDRSKP